jgi:hypothetical protein
MVPFEKHYGANMSTKRALLIVALAVGSFAVVSEAMALNPQPLPPRWSHPLDLRKAGGTHQEFKVQSRFSSGHGLKASARAAFARARTHKPAGRASDEDGC